jgi:hypothetical protein
MESIHDLLQRPERGGIRVDSGERVRIDGAGARRGASAPGSVGGLVSGEIGERVLLNEECGNSGEHGPVNVRARDRFTMRSTSRGRHGGGRAGVSARA